MTVAGDLATIDLPDLLQNIQSHGRTGTLKLSGEHGAARVLFRDGCLTALTADWRARLGERLVAAGHVTERRLTNARKRQAGSRRTVVEILVGARAITLEDLRDAAEHFVAEDVIDLISTASGEFEFVEGEPQKGTFDPDEVRLGLAIQVAPLILEATRRVDHWALIRKHLPNDSVHLRVREGVGATEDAEDPEFVDNVLAALDGSRSVEEVAAQFPDRRFECYKLVADLARDHAAKPMGSDDLLAVAQTVERTAPARARQIVRRGLHTEPQHEGLLEAEAGLSELLDDAGSSATARKLLAHICLESGRTEDALEHLGHAKRLTPNDPDVVERCMSVALLQGRRQDALHEGLQLVELYRAPGLHTRAKTVLERLHRVDPDSIEIEVELARSRVDCGDAPIAVRQLLRRGKALVANENYIGARVLFEGVLEIEPANREASVSVEMIDKEVYAERRERKRRLLRRALFSFWLLIAGFAVWLETAARLAYVDLRTMIANEELIEQRQYGEAAALWRELCRQHPVSLTAWFDVPHLIAELEARAHERGR
ncbi:MAG: DUF4388 domain-containing protein [Planctomycetes bacterium]|nr:DUF4388 domain-containing protein [Planctomycetota bacterium]